MSDVATLPETIVKTKEKKQDKLKTAAPLSRHLAQRRRP